MLSEGGNKCFAILQLFCHMHGVVPRYATTTMALSQEHCAAVGGMMQRSRRCRKDAELGAGNYTVPASSPAPKNFALAADPASL
jgi:hypothetical protein